MHNLKGEDWKQSDRIPIYSMFIDPPLGATVFGTGGDEVINMNAAWMYSRLPYTELQKGVFVHPTVSELVLYVFEGMEEP